MQARIHPSFETQSKTGVSVVPSKGLMFSTYFVKKVRENTQRQKNCVEVLKPTDFYNDSRNPSGWCQSQTRILVLD